MIRPQLEYASDVWDLHHVGDIMEIEKVHLRVARWVLNDYGRFSSVTGNFLTENISLIRKFKVKYFCGSMTSSKYFYLEHISLAIIHSY